MRDFIEHFDGFPCCSSPIVERGHLLMTSTWSLALLDYVYAVRNWVSNTPGVSSVPVGGIELETRAALPFLVEGSGPGLPPRPVVPDHAPSGNAPLRPHLTLCNADMSLPLHRPPGILLSDAMGHSDSTGTTIPPRALHGLPPDVGRLLSSTDKVYPRKVVRALEQGMFEYIPLDLLTDDACRRAMREPLPELSFVISNGKLRLPNVSFDVSKESKLSFGEWAAASDNLVGAMRVHLYAGSDTGSGGPVANAIADCFAAHFKHLKSRPNARMEFNLILDYDQRLRALFLRESHSFRMDTFHVDIWQECVASHHASRVKTLDNRLTEMERLLAHSKGPSLRFQESSSNTTIRSKCLSCGSLDHKLPNCRSTPRFLRREGRSWRAPNGNSICFAFNGLSSCDRGSKCLHAHVCSLCGATAHGAQTCAA